MKGSLVVLIRRQRSRETRDSMTTERKTVSMTTFKMTVDTTSQEATQEKRRAQIEVKKARRAALLRRNHQCRNTTRYQMRVIHDYPQTAWKLTQMERGMLEAGTWHSLEDRAVSGIEG